MKQEELIKIIATGVILGVTAAGIVWYLERFESNRLHVEVRDYLKNYDAFTEWLGQRPEAT